MKKIFLFLLVFFSISGILISCDALDDENQKMNTEEAFFFAEAAKAFPVSPIENTLDVAVLVTTKSNEQRSYSVSVNTEATTAPIGSYTIPSSGFVIEPDSYSGDFTISGDFDQIPDGETLLLVLDLTPSNGGVLSDKKQIIISMFRLCPLEESIAGAHTYVSSNLIRGQSATPNCDATPTGTVTWTDVAGSANALYRTSDMSFGMFANCWSVPQGAVSATLRVEWFCNRLIARGVDQYGDSYTYTVVSVVGPNMTLDWSNSYGDSGRAVITRAGGLDWPALLQD